VIVTLNQGYPDYVGRRFVWCGYANGPSSYTTGGETLTIPGLQQYIDSVDSSGSLAVSGNYWIQAVPSGKGPRATWKLKIYSSGGFTEVTSTTNLSAEVFQLSGLGGRY
jgi:hypothetical protein